MKTTQEKLASCAFRSNQEGVVAIEYALLAALIALAIIIGVALLGETLNTLFYEPMAKILGNLLKL